MNNRLVLIALVSILANGCISPKENHLSLRLAHIDAGNERSVFLKPNSCLAWVPESTLEYPYNRSDTKAAEIKFLPVSFFILISNESDCTIWYYSENCSWGYDSLTLEIKTENDYATVSRADGRWFRNFPMVETLQPGETLCWPISLDRRIWKQLPTSCVVCSFEARVSFANNFFLDQQCCTPISQNPIVSSWIECDPRTMGIPYP